MRLLSVSAALVLMAMSAPSTQAAAQTSPQTPPRPAGTALAGSAPAAPLGPPRGFVGYAQPEVNGTLCRNVSVTQTTCTIPPMTAGRYLVHAAATSTSQGEGAAQALVIQIGTHNCGRIDNKKPWPSGARTVRLDCEIVVMTDRALPVSAIYGDTKAVRDPRGPTLSLERMPWEGVLSAQVSAPKQ